MTNAIQALAGRRLALALLALLSFAASGGGPRADPADPAAGENLESMRREIARLEGELEQLRGREQGVLGQLDRLTAQLRLQEARLREATLQLRATERAIDESTVRLAELERLRKLTRRYLEFRLREMYKRGTTQALRQLVGGGEVESYVEGLRYAAWLSQRDRDALREFREQGRRLELESARLAEEQQRLAQVRRQASARRANLARSREERRRLLSRIREDRELREGALAELTGAALELSRLIEAFAPGEQAPRMDVRKFRGLLDPPARGKISAGFGKVVHPRFRTEVPHPGLDIDAREGSPFHSIFPGTVLFASWLRGYGLTVIVDHGAEVLSIYAHASVLFVDRGQPVALGQALGRVGDTGSLRGALLYFEIREAGRPVDPAEWLRRPEE